MSRRWEKGFVCAVVACLSIGFAGTAYADGADITTRVVVKTMDAGTSAHVEKEPLDLEDTHSTSAQDVQNTVPPR